MPGGVALLPVLDDAEPRADPAHGRRRRDALRDLPRRAGRTGARMAGGAAARARATGASDGSGGCSSSPSRRRSRSPSSPRSRSLRSFSAATRDRRRVMRVRASSRRLRSQISRATRFEACSSRSRLLASSERRVSPMSCARRCSRRTSVSCFRRNALSLQHRSAPTHDSPSSASGGRPSGLVRPKDLEATPDASCPRPRRGCVVQPDRPSDSRRRWRPCPRAGLRRRRDQDLATARGIRDAAFSPTGDEIVTGGDDRDVRVWRADGTLVWTLPLQGHVRRVALTTRAWPRRGRGPVTSHTSRCSIRVTVIWSRICGVRRSNSAVTDRCSPPAIPTRSPGSTGPTPGRSCGDSATADPSRRSIFGQMANSS